MPRSASGALEDFSLVARRIAPVRSVLVASPDYLARTRAATQRQATSPRMIA